MPVPQMRPVAPEPHEPVFHDLAPLRFEGTDVPLRLGVRRTDDGIWRARLVFGAIGTEAEHETAEIFCATTEQDLWAAVRDIRDHHLRDLYRSLTA